MRKRTFFFPLYTPTFIGAIFSVTSGTLVYKLPSTMGLLKNTFFTPGKFRTIDKIDSKIFSFFASCLEPH